MLQNVRHKQQRCGAMATERSRSMESEDHFKNGASPKSQTSRGNFIYLMMVVLLLMTAFVACEKDKDSKGDDNGGGGGGGGGNNPFVINATVVNGNDYNDYISTVKAVIYYAWGYGEDYVVASGEYKNGGFKLTLPATVPAEYLTEIGSDLPSSITISDRKAKVMNEALSIFAYDGEGDYIGRCFLDDEDGGDNYSGYLYVDRNVTIKGRYYDEDYYYEEVEYDCSLKKGWNIMYIIWSENGGLYTTQKPSGVNFKWYYYDGYKSPSDKKHKKVKL